MDALFRKRGSLPLSPEQSRVLERCHLRFRRAGAHLDAAAKERLTAIDERLAVLGTAFSARTCWPTSSPTPWCLKARPISPACRTFCLPRRAQAAGERGLAGKHVITLSRSSVEPFLQFSARRDLREKVFRAWIARGDGGGATDNKAIIAEMIALARRARAAHRL